MKVYVLAGLFALGLFTSCHTTGQVKKRAFTATYVGSAISETDWYNWCVSPIQGTDGKIHIFSSRWPADEGMEGWTGRNAQIAHFMGDRPEGPFVYQGVIMNTAMLPDTLTMAGPHNPRLEYVDGKYILLYILQNPQKGSMGQRIGMMIADDIHGKWRFAGSRDGIMVEPSTHPAHWTYRAAIGADNPAFKGDKTKNSNLNQAFKEEKR